MHLILAKAQARSAGSSGRPECVRLGAHEGPGMTRLILWEACMHALDPREGPCAKRQTLWEAGMHAFDPRDAPTESRSTFGRFWIVSPTWVRYAASKRRGIMTLRRFFCVLFCVLFCMAPMLASGCIIQIGDGSALSGGGGGSGAGEPIPSAPLLPEPDNVPSDWSNLTPEQQARRDEADRYVLENLYKGYTILRTVQDPNGDIIDWIAPESMAQLPYEPPTLPWSIDQIVLPPGGELAQSELEKYPELFGPIGSTPLHRPMYWGYVLGETGATSIQDYLDNYRVSGQTGAPNRLYAGLISEVPNRGLGGFMNQFAPLVEENSFSLMEFAMDCLGAPGASVEKELIGIVLSLDKRNDFWSSAANGYSKHLDDLVRLHVESFRIVNGVSQGGWDQDSPGFVVNPYNTKYPLDSVVPVSTPGSPPVEHMAAIFQVPGGDWWVTYNGWFLGYFKASQFTMLNNGGCRASWYLEVLDIKPGTAWAQTQMGTGKFGHLASLGEAAWVRKPMYLDMNYLPLEVTVDAHMGPEKLECYRRSDLLDMGSGLGRYFLAGGPGGFNLLCTK